MKIQEPTSFKLTNRAAVTTRAEVIDENDAIIPFNRPSHISTSNSSLESNNNKTLWMLGSATVASVTTSLIVHLTNLLGDFKKPIGLLSDSISIFLGTCFGAGLLSAKNNSVGSSDHTYSNS